VHVLQIVEAGRDHRPADRGGGGLHLRHAADLFGQEIGGEGRADGKRRRVGSRRAVTAGEHEEMGRQAALGSARHHQGDPRADGLWRASKRAGESRLQGDHGEVPGEVVDAAIALGLAEDGQNLGRRHGPGRDEVHHTGDIGGVPRRHAEDEALGHRKLC